MKKLFFALALLVAGSFAIKSSAQNLGPEWGETPEDRMLMARYLNFLPEQVNRGNYGKAGFYLYELINKAPKAHPAIYAQGAQMFRRRAAAETDAAQKKVLVDSLMLMHELHLENFGEQNPETVPLILQNMAVDYMKFMPDDRVGIAEHLKKAVDMAGENVNPSLVLTYFNELTNNFRTDHVSMEDYMAEFDRMSTLLGCVCEEEDVMKQLESLMVSSGAANCDNIENLFGPQIDADPDNEELLEKTVALLQHAKCTDRDFYMKVAELYYNVKPSPRTALVISEAYKVRGNTKQAMEYIHKALATTEDPSEKVELLLALAANELNETNFRQAYSFANEVIAIDPRNPTAHFIIGNAIGGGSSAACQDNFERRAAFWLAVDRLQDARRFAVSDPGCKIKVSDIDSAIASYRANFPSKEEVFFRTLNEGDPYEVKCGWITGKTTVREKP